MTLDGPAGIVTVNMPFAPVVACVINVGLDVPTVWPRTSMLRSMGNEAS
jgi:hypothetical protein